MSEIGHRPAPPEVHLRERVKAPPAPELVAGYYAPSVAGALTRIFAHEMQIHLAHGLMLAEQGIVSEPDIGRTLRVILDLIESGPAVLAIDYSQEDLYSYVERHVVQRLGPDVGGRLHTGRSRNDLNVTSWRMALRDMLVDVLGRLAELRRTALELAAGHVATVMPGYTHTQHAQPISLGYYLLSVADLLARDGQRLAQALGHVDLCPLGAGALTTTGFPIDRSSTALRLGFTGLVEVAYDAVASRDDAHETAAALAILMTGLSRVATDLQAWNMAEAGFIELADQFSSVSSIMPQKKNPQGLEYAKAAAANVTGALTTVLACAKITSFSDVNDGVTAVNLPVLDAAERTAHALAVMRGVLATMQVKAEAMAHAAAIGFGTATELADVIVRETGLSFRIAHNIVGRVVRVTIQAGRHAPDITTEDLDRAAAAQLGRTLGIAAEAVTNALDPAQNLASRRVTGGPAPAMVRTMIEERRLRLQADATAIAARRAHLDACRAGLAAEAAALAERVEGQVAQ